MSRPGWLDEIARRNTVIGTPVLSDDSQIRVDGTGNVLFFEPGVTLRKSSIHLRGDNSVLFVSTPFEQLCATVTMGSDACLYLGSDLFSHPDQIMRINVDDGSLVHLGNDVLSSTDVTIDTAGPGNSLWVGDHVWLCQSVSLVASCHIASHTIVASRAMLDSIATEPYSCWGGTGRRLMEDVLFSKVGLRLLDHRQLARRAVLSQGEARELYRIPGFSHEAIDRMLQDLPGSAERAGALEREKRSLRYRTPHQRPLRSIPMFVQDLYRSARANPDDNRVIGTLPDDGSCHLTFGGHGNLLMIEPGADLTDATIRFPGNDAILYLSAGNAPYRILATINTESCCFIGHDVRFANKSRKPRISSSEGSCIVIGNNARISNRTWFRTSDQHAIYRRDTLERINGPGPIMVGDGAVVMNSCLVQKGAVIESGETVRPSTLVTRKKGGSTDPLYGFMRELASTLSVEERLGIMREMSDLA